MEAAFDDLFDLPGADFGHGDIERCPAVQLGMGCIQNRRAASSWRHAASTMANTRASRSVFSLCTALKRSCRW